MHKPTSPSRLRIIVLGYLVRGPLGGLAWHYLQYVIGLSKLGHDVCFVEQSDDYPSCYHPVRNAWGIDPSYGLAFARDAFRSVGVGDCWAFFDTHARRWLGPQSARIQQVCAEADLCLNVSGRNELPPLLEQIPVRALVDTDPAFTQIRHLTDDDARQRAQQHNAFFTFAENLPAGCADVPDDGLPWQATRQPVVLDMWPACPPEPGAKFTSVMLWESYGGVDHEGRRYGQKAESFTPYLDLPQRAGHLFELALGSSSAPGSYLQSLGWDVIDPLPPTRDPWTYQRYIQASKGEFGIAKHGYVVTRSGWFSERSACYLATGRPVVVQDTGFTLWLPGGDGVLPFSTPAEALAAIAEANGRYEHHCRAAREIAETYFDARSVLGRLIETAMNTPADAERASLAQATGGGTSC